MVKVEPKGEPKLINKRYYCTPKERGIQPLPSILMVTLRRTPMRLGDKEILKFRNVYIWRMARLLTAFQLEELIMLQSSKSKIS